MPRIADAQELDEVEHLAPPSPPPPMPTYFLWFVLVGLLSAGLALYVDTIGRPQAPHLLFHPIRVGDLQLKHRVVMAPMTRYRADKDHVPLDMVAEHYAQRASVPGTLLITEGTLIAPQAGGSAHVPGIWSDAQIAAWRRVTDGVHAKNSSIFLQLWALGRTADVDTLKAEDPAFELVSASDVKLSTSKGTPRALTEAEIREYVGLYAKAAKNAVEGAGFDGVEIQGANGHLIDQFLQSVSNTRTDAYGGSVENRARFALEVIDAVAAAVGPKRTGIRISPWSTYKDMRMPDPLPQFSHLVVQIAHRQPELAYIHAVEPDVAESQDPPPRGESNQFIRAVWSPRPMISTGGYTLESALRTANERGGLIAFGRLFTSNPDLPQRLREEQPLRKYDPSTLYTPERAEGYIDQPAYAEEVARRDEL